MTSRFSKLSSVELVETHEALTSIAENLAFAYDEIAILRKDYPGVSALSLTCLEISDNIAMIDMFKRDLEDEIKQSHTLSDDELFLLSFG